MAPGKEQSAGKKIFQLVISLDEVQPPIWRRIQVPSDISLFKLHFIFQIAMGWTNSHLHEYHIGDQYYGTPDEDGWDTREIKDEKAYRLEQVIPGKGTRFGYLYDFGDSWEHTMLVEDILELAEGERYPLCLDGARACPPEDVGGTWGYEGFLEAIADPNHPEHDDYLTWVGGDFDPEAFDRDRTDAELKNIDRSEMVRIYQRYYSGEVGPELKRYRGISEWLEALTAEEHTQLAELPLRRDTVCLLTYLRDHRVTGTQSTGNLPLKAIREATASFVHPPALEEKIGDQVFKIRSEYDIWPVYFIHSLLEVGGLLEGGPGRRLRLTLTTLDHLLMLPAERSIPFEEFADRLIRDTGLKWEAQDMTHARDSLHTAIERMVIDILQDFHAVERKNKDAHIGSYHFKKLHTFTVTKLGRGLLRAVAGGPF